jgi:hypothetical protein
MLIYVLRWWPSWISDRHYSTWLPGPIICSDWLKFQRSSSLKLMNWLNPNCKGMIIGMSFTKLLFFMRRRSLKCEKFTDRQQTTDAGRQVMAIVHLDLWSRWTKNDISVDMNDTTKLHLIKWEIQLFHCFRGWPYKRGTPLFSLQKWWPYKRGTTL